VAVVLIIASVEVAVDERLRRARPSLNVVRDEHLMHQAALCLNRSEEAREASDVITAH